MFKVDRDAEGRYYISIGSGRLYKTKDIQEVKAALDHFYMNDNGQVNPGNCPLCRQIADFERRWATK